MKIIRKNFNSVKDEVIKLIGFLSDPDEARRKVEAHKRETELIEVAKRKAKPPQFEYCSYRDQLVWTVA